MSFNCISIHYFQYKQQISTMFSYKEKQRNVEKDDCFHIPHMSKICMVKDANVSIYMFISTCLYAFV